MSKKNKRIHLSERDRAILLQGKTDMIYPEVVLRRFFADGNMDAARSVLRRLCGEAPEYLYLRPEPLDERRVYYRLTREATRLLGISPKCAVALKKLGKVKRYAVSWFIHADQPGKRVRFNPLDFAEQFAIAGESLTRHPFFIDETTDRPKLGIIFVDHKAHIRRILHKTVKPLARFLRHGWFDSFIRQHSFIVAVLTFNSFRKRAILAQLPPYLSEQLRYPLSRLLAEPQECLPIDIQVHVIPGMDALVSPETSKGTTP